MLYEALTRQWPYSGQALEILLCKQQDDPPHPREVVAGVGRELSELAMRLLSRSPTERAGGQEILTAVGADPEPPVRSPVVSLTLSPVEEEDGFVGRMAELGELGDAFAATTESHPVVAEVRGRSGMGKTALVSRFLTDLQRHRSAVVLAGRCYEQESVPFKALDSVIDVLCGYLMSLTPVAATALLPRNIRALSRLFPVLERIDVIREAPDGAASVPDVQELRQRAVSALGELLRLRTTNHRIGDRGKYEASVEGRAICEPRQQERIVV